MNMRLLGFAWIAALSCVLSFPVTTSAERRCGAGFGPALPAGTYAETAVDGSLQVRAPKGWFFFVKDDGGWSVGHRAVLRCRCESGTGCSPTLLPNGQTFCAMSETCGTCTRSGAARVYAVPEGVEGVTFASSDDLASRPRADAGLLEIPEVREELMLFRAALGISESQGKALQAESAQWVMIRIFGYVAPMALPEGWTMPTNQSPAMNQGLALLANNLVTVSASAVRCRCDAGSSCRLESNFGVKVCNASQCSDCTMTY